MTLHFAREEYAARAAALRAAMAARGLDAMLLFAPESQYWLTGHDTFGFCFFQVVVVTPDRMAIQTRSADRLQAKLTSTLDDIRVWRDRAGADPTEDLWEMLRDFGLEGARLGVETDTHGLTAHNWRRLAARLEGRARLEEASDIVSVLRLTKSPAEIAFVRHAAALADAAWDAALPLIGPGAEEGAILAAMQGEVFRCGGDYPGNEFILGSGEMALLCRSYAGTTRLREHDQLTLEWAGVWRHYHAALMRTVVVGEPRPEHARMHEAARAALVACEDALRPGRTMGDVYAAHADAFDRVGFGRARLNACGYSLGARFSPSWMEREMFYEGAETVIGPDMVFFLHMILADEATGAAMTLGRTSLVTASGAEPLSRMSLGLPIA